MPAFVDRAPLLCAPIFLVLALGCGGYTDPDKADADGDGYPGATDCVDDDPTIHPGAEETPYDGIDQDCDGADLVDVDQDGAIAAEAGGDDCDDTDGEVSPLWDEVCKDGKDNDCDGTANDCELRGVHLIDNVATTTFTGEVAADYAGTRARPIGDFDGDGYVDLLITAYKYDLPTVPAVADVGAAYILYGSATGFTSSVLGVSGTKIAGTDANNWLGLRVAAAGDVDKDGYADFLISSSLGLHLVYGEGARPATISIADLPTFAGSGFAPNSDVYEEFAGGEDLDGDGYDDIAIGAPSHSIVASAYEGAVWVLYGSETRFSGTIDVVATTPTFIGSVANTRLGIALAMGDLNGDGYAELVMASADNANSYRGATFIAYGSNAKLGTSLGTSALPRLDGSTTNSYLGWWLKTADFDGDGRSELMLFDGVLQAMYVIAGSETRLLNQTYSDVSAIAMATAIGSTEAPLAYNTTSAAAGDINGDGVGDLVVGAHTAKDGAGTSVGAAFVLYGPLDATPRMLADADIVLYGDASGDNVGRDVFIRDLDGDGFAELGISARFDNAGVNNGGAVFIVPGGGI